MSDDDEMEFAQKERRRLAKDKARLAPLVIRPGQLGQPGQEDGQQPGVCTTPTRPLPPPPHSPCGAWQWVKMWLSSASGVLLHARCCIVCLLLAAGEHP
jgi:hypothetical protein